jgi:3-hydroxymyristoyl/3-hydroxydecanoyl-(acyl carrier protein) dehydratase
MTDTPEIHRYLPQRPPFVMVDRIVEAGPQQAVTVFSIPQDNVLIENGFFSEAGLLENIAQSAGAVTGFKAYSNGQEAPVGFIGAIKAVKIHRLPEAGSSIRTAITFGQSIGAAHMIDGAVYSGDELIASATLTIFLQSPPQPS